MELEKEKPWAIQLPLLRVDTARQEKRGVIYTKAWVVDLLLDLCGYRPERNLVDTFAVEPAAGDGAFLVPMARRLAASCFRQERPIQDCMHSLLAYELNDTSAVLARTAVTRAVIDAGVTSQTALSVTGGWIRTGDYLSDAPTLPRADFVIGNPPYIRLEDIDESVGAAYRAAYRTMCGRADIYVAFFEAALRQLKRAGVCAFICADRWMLNQYGAELRQFVTANYAVETIVDMHTADAFASKVSAYPALTVIRRATQGEVVVARTTPRAEFVGHEGLARSVDAIRASSTPGDTPAEVLIGLTAARVATWFRGTEPWPCISPERLALLKRLEEEFPALESSETATKVGIGVATGLDEVLITTDPELVERSRLLPLAMACDLVRGELCWSGHYLVDPWSAEGLVDLSQFPRLAAYYDTHRERLQGRHVGKHHPQQWYRTIDRVNHRLTRQHKLYIPDIKGQIEPVLDAGQTYPHHNLYFVHSTGWNIEVLGGLLMSALGQFFVECYGVRLRGGYLRFQAQYLRRIRVPRPQDLSLTQATRLVDAFRRRDVALATQTALEVYHIAALPTDHTEAPFGP